MAIADFNGDGELDFVVDYINGIYSGKLLLLGKGDGTFQSAVDLGPSTDLGGQQVIVGDFNADGLPDLAVADTAYTSNPKGALVVLLNTSAGHHKLSHRSGDRRNTFPLSDYRY